ncbi:MAG: hypothetical protein MJ120_00905 [Clostridia bacterium]|nr:hypothetical protein [Clostridia bacterium]
MSKKDYNMFDDDVMSNLEKLKAKYSDFGIDDDEPVERPKPVMDEVEPEEYYDEQDSYDYDSEDADEDYYEEYEEEQYPENDNYVNDDVHSPADYDEAEEYEEVKKPKKKKGKKKNKSQKVLTTILAILIFVIIWGAFFGIDFVLASSMQKPFFCVKTAEYENGSVDYTGLFYKFQYHVEDNGENLTVCLPWLMKGPNDELKEGESKNEPENKPDLAGESAKQIKITVPKEFYGELVDGKLELTDEQKAQGFESVELSKDKKSAVFTIEKDEYDAFIGKMREQVRSDLASIAEDKDYPSIKKVEYTNDFSNVTLYVDSKLYETSLDHFISESIFEWVGQYKAFTQREPVCDLVVKDVVDGTIVEDSKG